MGLASLTGLAVATGGRRHHQSSYDIMQRVTGAGGGRRINHEGHGGLARTSSSTQHVRTL